MTVVSSVQVVPIELLELTGATELGGTGAEDPYPVGTAAVELDPAAAMDEDGGTYPCGAELYAGGDAANATPARPRTATILNMLTNEDRPANNSNV